MLDLIRNPPTQKLAFLEMPGAPDSNRELIEYFRDTIWPVLNKRERLGIQASAFHTILDRALYNDEAEKQSWMEEKNGIENEAQRLSTDPVWQEQVKIFAQKAGQIPGELADFARRSWEDIELSEFTEKERPLLERLTELSTEISNLSNTSDFVPKLGPTEKAVNDAIQHYFEGKVDFERTWKAIESYQPQGRTAHGQDVATRGRNQLQECAIIRTKLAKSKGYDSWSDYIMASQARHYSPEFKTADQKIEFLKSLLQATKKPYEEFLEKRLSEIPGASRKNLRRSQLSLIQLEDETLVRKYFPLERIEQEWEKAMLESGFTKEDLACICLDGYPRPGKYTHAYMNNVSSHGPKALSINVKTLNIEKPELNAELWNRSRIFIVQNYRDDGPHAWNTAWHEGGHAMDYIYQQDLLGYGAAYGYTETHSMTMERFFEDLDYLIAVGKSRDGEALPKELAKKYITHARINALTQMRTQVAYALFDLMLWKKSYTENSNTHFVDYANEIFGELVHEATGAEGFTMGGVDWRMTNFATSHFYGGGVRYFGYIVADMAAQMTAEALWKTFEKSTGRKTFYRQPTLGPLLSKAYYTNGFLKEFPRPIEEFTGMKFSPQNMVGGIIQTVNSWASQKDSPH